MMSEIETVTQFRSEYIKTVLIYSIFQLKMNLSSIKQLKLCALIFQRAVFVEGIIMNKNKISGVISIAMCFKLM